MKISWHLSLTITSMVSLPSWTAVSSRGSMVSNPGKPGGGLALFFSSTAWGAETDHSIRIIIQHTLLSLETLTIKWSPRIYQRSLFATIQFLHKEGLWYLYRVEHYSWFIAYDSRSYHDLWQSSQWCQCSPTEYLDPQLLPGTAWPDLYSDLSYQGRQRSRTGGEGPLHRLQPILSPWLLLWPISETQNRDLNISYLQVTFLYILNTCCCN